MEKVVQLVNGPVGSLIGAGLQVAVGGIPLGPRGSRILGVMKDGGLPVPPDSWLSPQESDHQKFLKIYDNIEAHLQGAKKVLKPVLEIKDMIVRGSKSADTALAKPQDNQIAYYTPQKNRSSSGDRQCCKCHENNISKLRSTENSSPPKSSKSEPYCRKKRDNRKMSPDNSDSTASALKKSGKKICSKSSRHSTRKSSIDLLSYKKKNNSKENDEPKNCAKCGISIVAVKILAVIPCGHVFCYQCIPPVDFVACPICKKPLILSDVTRISKFT